MHLVTSCIRYLFAWQAHRHLDPRLEDRHGTDHKNGIVSVLFRNTFCVQVKSIRGISVSIRGRLLKISEASRKFPTSAAESPLCSQAPVLFTAERVAPVLRMYEPLNQCIPAAGQGLV